MKKNGDNKRKAKVKAALKKVNKNHGRTLAKRGESIDREFKAEVEAFIQKNRIALERLSKK